MQNCYTLFISNTSFRLNILAGAPRVNHSHGSNSVLLPLSSILCRKSSCIIVLGRPQWSSFLNTTFLALLQSDDASFGLSLIHCSKLFQASAISPIHRCFVLQCCVRVLTNLQSILPTWKIASEKLDLVFSAYPVANIGLKPTQHLSLHCCVVWSTWTSNLYG